MQEQSVRVERIGKRLYCKRCKKSWVPRVPLPVSCAKCKREINWSGIEENKEVSQAYEEDREDSSTKRGEVYENEEANDDKSTQEQEHSEDIEELEEDYSDEVKLYAEEEDIEVDSKFDESEESKQSEDSEIQMVPAGLQFKDVDKLFRDSAQFREEIPSETKKDIQNIPDIPIPDLNQEDVEGLIGGAYNNENNRKKASTVLWDFLNRNKKNIQDRITSKLGVAAGGGASLDPLLIEGLMTVATLLLMKFEENREKNENLKKKKKEIRKLNENLVKKKSEPQKAQSLYNIDPPDKLQELILEKNEKVYNTFEIEPMEGTKMKKETNEHELEEIISDEEVEGIFNFFENIPEELLTQAIETQEDIAGGPYKLFVQQRIEELDQDQMQRIEKIVHLDEKNLHKLIEELARKEKSGKMNLLCTKRGLEFLRININSLRKILKN